MVILPTVDAKALKLEADIATALRDGMAKSFGDNLSPFALQAAQDFANNAAPGIKDAIMEFLKTLIVNIPSAPVTGSCPAGPVAGTAVVTDQVIIVE